jgi:hypothetical protein
MGKIDKAIRSQFSIGAKNILVGMVAQKLSAAEVDRAKELASEFIEMNSSSDKSASDFFDRFGIEFNESDFEELEKKTSKYISRIPAIVQDLNGRIAKSTLRTFKLAWPEQEALEAAALTEFHRRLHTRWSGGLSLLRMLHFMVRDLGNERAKKNKRRKNDRLLSDVLLRLHARGCQVADEAITLLSSGFADGAMARWRTLYEIVVVATVISEFGEEIALRYIAHTAIENKAGMDLYLKSYAEAGEKRFSKKQQAIVQKEYERVVATYGKSFVAPYGWAAKHLGLSKPIFSNLEFVAKSAETRSTYKMASYNVHASAHGIVHRLGVYDAEKLIIAGASNAGLSVPAQNVAISLVQLTQLLLGKRLSIDETSFLKMLVLLSAEIGEKFCRVEATLKRDEQALKQKAGTRPRGQTKETAN